MESTNVIARPVALPELFAAALLVLSPAATPLPPDGAALAVAPWLALAAGGLCAGYLAGLLGIGGALVTMPVLYAVLPALGVGPEVCAQAAVFAALVAMVPTTLTAAVAHHRRGAIAGPELAALAPAFVAGAIVGALLATHLKGSVLMLAFAAQGLYYGVRILGRPVAVPTLRSAPFMALGARTPGWLFGSVVGGFCASVGMGCSSMAAPYLHSRGLELRRAVATASTLNLALAGSGIAALLAAAASAPAGDGLPLQHPCLAGLLIGCVAMLAAPCGVASAHRRSETVLRHGVGAINVVGALAIVAQVAVGASAR